MNQQLTEETKIEAAEQAANHTAKMAVLVAEVSADLENSRGRDNGEELQQFAAQILQSHGGREIRALGTSLMAEFREVGEAVRAAMELQRALQSPSAAMQRGRVRVGIHACSVEAGGIGAFGGMVHTAAGITRQAAAGQILISRQVSEAIAGEEDMHCQWHSHAAMDGQQEASELFEVSWIEAPANFPSRYKALFQIGAGGMGVVYKVRDLETGEIVALKLLRSVIADDPAMQDSLRREVCLARKVTHKNVCRIHEFNRSESAASISMEYVAGQSLQRLLSQNGPMTWSQACGITEQICAGLREAHLQGIVHRDLKPANVMMDNAGVVKVMDFGIARLLENTGYTTGTLAGTPAYMAPEQLQQRRLDARTDVYAIGLLLYEMVTGVPAFHAETPVAVALQQIQTLPMRPREINPAVPTHAESIILKCLQKDPAGRFASVDELRMALAREGRPVPSLSIWQSFLVDFGRLGQDLKPGLSWTIKTARAGAESASSFAVTVIRGAADRLTDIPRAQKAIAAGVAALLCIAAVSAVELHKHPLTKATAIAAVAVAPAAVSPVTSADDAPRNMISESVSMNGSFSSAPIDLAPARATAHAEPEAETTRAAIRTSLKSAESHAAPVVAPRTAKAANAHERSDASKLSANAAPAQPAAVVEVSESAVATAAIAPAPASVAVAKPAAEPSATTGAAAAAAAPASKPVDAPTAASASDADRFLLVGSFKDPAWADEAVDKLTQLGFHAISLHQKHLFASSFNVEVGPFDDSKQLETARTTLSKQGFKPRAVK